MLETPQSVPKSQTILPTLDVIAQSGMPQSLGLISVDRKNLCILDSSATNHLIVRGGRLALPGIPEDFTSGMMIPLPPKGLFTKTRTPTLQQNGAAKRKNCYLLEVACSLMLFTSLPSYLWADVILTAAHLVNRMPSHILHPQTPLDCLKESYPSTHLVPEVPLRVFGVPLIDWPLYQLDVKNVFLNGDLVKEVYMSPLPGFEAQFSQQLWKIVVLIVYVDDIVLTRDDQVEIGQLKQRMDDEFEIKNLGNLKYFLEMEVARSKGGFSVSQRKYTIDLLTEIGIQFMQAPYEKHMEVIKSILIYLKTTLGKRLMFRKTDKKTIKVYTDSDWAGSIIDKKSTSSYCTFVWGNLVTWMSKKPSVVAKSSAMKPNMEL
ncbi:Copia protein [Cucumis melo var. makuwa]|uniref:Copia protein n=1 Tax=Cucumis melo var. makuwa TaxID=1194695 RepID=A0A5D3CWN9_CUCMM|nr:Copia protein [Cucumis melo var. makuwa]